MLRTGPAGHQYIIQADENKRKAGKNFVHKTLKRLASIFEPKRCSLELEEAKRSYDGRLWYVGGRHRNLMVSLSKVNFAKNLQPASRAVRSSMWGVGYRSGLVTKFNRL